MFQNPDEIKFDKYWNPKIYIDNTLGEPKETITNTVVYDTNKWEAYIVERRRVKGTFLENLELFQFPFDTQVDRLLAITCNVGATLPITDALEAYLNLTLTKTCFF